MFLKFFARGPLLLGIIITDLNIIAHVNTACPYDRHTQLKVYFLELILDRY